MDDEKQARAERAGDTLWPVISHEVMGQLNELGLPIAVIQNGKVIRSTAMANKIAQCTLVGCSEALLGDQRRSTRANGRTLVLISAVVVRPPSDISDRRRRG